MLKKQILELQKSQSYPSITITLPTSRYFIQTIKDKIALKNLIKEAEENLKRKVDKKDTAYFVEKIQKAVDEIDFHHLLDGLGIFVNRNSSFVFKFPFSVPKLAIVDDTFFTKFLIKAFNRNIRYLVLSIAEKPARLFVGFNDSLAEIINGDFPIDIDDVLDVAPPHTKLDFETFQEEKLKQFIRLIDSRLEKYLKEEALSLIISGVTKNVSLFLSLTKRNEIVDTIVGNYDKKNFPKLIKLSWESIRKHNSKFRENILNTFSSEFSSGKGSMGLLEIWMLANQGRVKTLLVEENYHQAAKFQHNTPIFINNPEGPYVIDDLVDEVAELVFKQKGDVYFYEDGRLKNYQRIGAILRY